MSEKRWIIVKEQIKHYSVTLVIVVAVIAVGLVIFVYSDVYNIAADDHHSRLVFAALQTLRDRSIEFRSARIDAPNLDDPALILKGTGQTAAMCTECHLAPGMTNSEVRVGMYPQPPDLSRTGVEPRAAFWVIKHRIKISAMRPG